MQNYEHQSGDRWALSAYFEATMANGAREACVAVIEHRAPWPTWLDSYLTGKQDVLVLAQLPGESRRALARRLDAKLSRLSSPLRQLVWVSNEETGADRIKEVLGHRWEHLCASGGMIVAAGERLLHHVSTDQGGILLSLSPGQVDELSAEVA